MQNVITKGSFTLPGESGYEDLTLELAKKWGADVIRDSDGTALSEEILQAGYSIYSTLCIIRDHNTWAKQHMDKLQQTFLITSPKVAEQGCLCINLMEEFFNEQFKINGDETSVKRWEVYDRTDNVKVDRNKWHFDRESHQVVLTGIKPWHTYTVSFLAYRIWEEISMYNHTTNHWTKEHLMQIDPIHAETQSYLLNWMKDWCETHTDTDVVRFTSMFYNFVWIWGSDKKNPYLFSDWGSYDFTVSPKALDKFAKVYGYQMTAEDFVNGGKYQVSHMPADQHKRDWMDFIMDQVLFFGKQLIDIVHSYGKLAYVFYDDSWIGVEPYSAKFKEYGFDGLIKCVFSGFEARLCAGVEGVTHELRLHPYLFPVGLGGLPTFMEGGDPTRDAKNYWIQVRRALLRVPIDRIGLGGYLHLVENYPDFCNYIEDVANEFRKIKDLHGEGKPFTSQKRIGILHSWGALRSWTLSGHFHETYMHDLIHVIEALSGLPFDVNFFDFEDIKNGVLDEVDVLFNIGEAGTAWSGGKHWEDSEVVEVITRWVHEGGCFFGINQPSAVEGYDHYFRMAHVLGVDEDTGARVSHGKWQFETTPITGLIPEGTQVTSKARLFLTNPNTQVWMSEDGQPTLTHHNFGKGCGVYMSSFVFNTKNTKLLFNLLLHLEDQLEQSLYITNNSETECAYYPKSQTLIVINNSESPQNTSIRTESGVLNVELAPFETKIMEVK